MKKQISGYVIAIVGFLLLAGVAGSSDYYDACLAAADCVAGERPSLIGEIVQSIVGLFLMATGYNIIKES